MASTIDSGIDTGNDSNDSSLQEKFSKMDLELPPQSNPGDSSKDNSACLEEKDQNQAHTSSGPAKVDEPLKSTTLIPSPLYQLPPLSESCIRSFNWRDVMSSSEVGDMFVGAYGREYAARDLVTKMHRMRQALRLRCLRRSPCHPGPAHFSMLKEHFKICRAVSHNNTDAVKEMLMAGVTPNCYDAFKRTPLHLAACMGYTDMVKLLLGYGADPNAKDSIGNTALHLAACTNHVKVISLLMQAGTRLSEKDLAGHSPLELAITKLNIMKRAVTPNPVLQEQITQVVQMMSEYMKRKERVEPALLSRLFSVVMQVKDSSEEVESNIQDLMSNLSLSSKS